MASATVQNITAVPSLSTKNSNGILVRPGVSSTVWDPVNGYVDGTGSFAPVTFRIPGLVTQPYSLSMTANIAVVLTAHYSGTSFDLEGSVILPNGNELKVLTSIGRNVPTPLPNPPAPVAMQISNFQFHDDLHLENSCPVPFRVAGDFIWRLTFLGLPAITVVRPTRLEICFARAAAPIGPAYTGNPALTKTRVNLNGIYPIGLVRLFFPAPTEFAAIANFNNPSVYGPFFAARVVDQVWKWGNPQGPGRPQYDARGGASYYNVGGFGGGFNLQDWLAVTYRACNCYDLAGIVQLGCCLLLSSIADELLDSRWVFQNPNGFVRPCILYGWGQTYPSPPGVNNPFFLNANGTPGRQPFGNHAWVEVLHDPDNTNYRTVLDATTAVATGAYAWPDNGSRSRVQYATAHIDAAADPTGGKTGNLVDRKVVGPSTGDCYTNYSYYTSSTTYPVGALGRIGVFNASGITPPTLLEHLSSVPQVDKIMSEIEMLLSKGQNPANTISMFNAASMKSDQLVELITRDSSVLKFSNYQVRVAEGVTVLRIMFDGAPYTGAISAVVAIEIHVFNTFRSARLALIHALSSFTPPGRLSEHFRALSTPLAETALLDTDGQNLLFLRGNSFCHIRLVPEQLVAPDPAKIHPLEPLAQRLDQHLADNNVPQGSEDVPSIILKSPIPTTVRVGDDIVLETQQDYAAIEGSSSNGSIVVCAGRKNGVNFGIEFFALAEGEVELTLNVAHENTLLPANMSWKVNVSSA
ncbi:hypothetical protein ONS95_004460 [Cadophora gregata]|uniref:uncharacterized protein n=1 Tax=Cadophora gregata TaxID=51156 RepID=UPI0026DC3FC4|nr:uncharacterized protein ONS95_004460 [Cadophora gregata]KAK0105141.1 hypothetical protein ONS96_004543 [Cadophora gregata f. sp. sojae]KAK0105949.1 hypothetical protein ONS95_004460 [Cadophora gregata]